jgi:hypothetical protein
MTERRRRWERREVGDPGATKEGWRQGDGHAIPEEVRTYDVKTSLYIY